MSSSHTDYNYVLQNVLTFPLEARSTLTTQIDTEITALRNRLRYLCNVRNTLTPVYRLPREVLAKIFALVQVGVKGQVSVKRILPASWVSQLWREIAIGYPVLWDHIGAVNSRWASHCLTRSRKTPLFVDLSDDAVKNIKEELGMKRLLQELPRFRYLHRGKAAYPALDEWVEPEATVDDTATGVEVPDDDVLLGASDGQMDQDLPTKSVALLDTLHASDPQDLTKAFLHVKLEHLTTLKLKECTFNWEDVIFPTLKTLHLDKPAESSRISLTQFFNSLSKLRLLEDVNLRYVLSTESISEIGQHLPHINLRNISSFKIWDQLELMVAVLNHISIPQPASLTITIDSELWVEGLQRCMPFVASRFSSPAQLDMIAIDRISKGRLSLGFGQRTEISGGITTETTLHVQRISGQLFFLSQFSPLFNSLPKDRVRSLHIQGYWIILDENPVDLDALIRILRGLPNVEDMHLHGSVAARLLENLENSPSATFPPGLKRITYNDIATAYRRNGRLSDTLEVLASRENLKNGQLKMIVRDSRLERSAAVEAVFDEIYADEAEFLFFKDE